MVRAQKENVYVPTAGTDAVCVIMPPDPVEVMVSAVNNPSGATVVLGVTVRLVGTHAALLNCSE